MKKSLCAMIVGLLLVSCGSRTSEVATPTPVAPSPQPIPPVSGTVFGRTWKFSSSTVFRNGATLIVRLYDVEIPVADKCNFGWKPPANATGLSFWTQNTGNQTISLGYVLMDERASATYGAIASTNDTKADVTWNEKQVLGQLTIRHTDITLTGQFTADICN